MSTSTVIDYRDGFAMKGVKGSAAGSATERLHKRGTSNNEAYVEVCLVPCDSNCDTCTDRLDNCSLCSAPDYLLE